MRIDPDAFTVGALDETKACFACHGKLAGETVWLGETYDGVEKEWPFHPKCADDAWPLYETRRSITPTEGTPA